jgi:hypothetical protein
VLSLSERPAAVGAPEPGEALAVLRAALRRIVEYRFVPLALEAFTTAYALAPDLTGEPLLAVAAYHPAGRYHTRRRAGRLLRARGPAPGGEPKRAAVAGLTADALLRLGEELDRRLGGEAVLAVGPPHHSRPIRGKLPKPPP